MSINNNIPSSGG